MKDFANWNAQFESEFFNISVERRKKPSAFLTVIPEKQDWLDFVDFLRREWRYGRIVEFPFCLITLFSGIAFFEYKHKKFWEHFADTVGVPLTSINQNDLNDYFLHFANEIGLEMLTNQRGNDFVGSAIYQIGVPLSLWQDFLKICESLWWKDNWRNFSSQDWEEFVTRKVGGLQRLKRFLIENPNTSRKFIEEVHDARHLISSNEIEIEEISQISFLRAEHFEEVPETAEFLNPNNPELLFKNRFQIVWNESDAKISLYLPPVNSDKLPAIWKLNDLQVNADLYQQEFEINSLAFQPKISLQLKTETKTETKKLKGIEDWALFDDESGRLVNTEREFLPLKSYTLISPKPLQNFTAKGFDNTIEQILSFELKDSSSCCVNRLVPLEQNAKVSFTCQERKIELEFRVKGKVEIFLLAGIGNKAAQFRLFEKNTLKTDALPIPCLTLPLGLFDEGEVNLSDKFKVLLNEQEISGNWQKNQEDNHKEVFFWQWNEEITARKKLNLIIECKGLAIKKEFKIEVLQSKDNLMECWENMPSKFLPFILLAQPNFKSDLGTTFDEMREIKEIIAPNERFVGLGFYYFYEKLGVLKGFGQRWQFAQSKLFLGEDKNGNFLRFCGNPSIFWQLLRFLAEKFPQHQFDQIDVIAKRDEVTHLFLPITREQQELCEKYVKDYGRKYGLSLVDEFWEENYGLINKTI